MADRRRGVRADPQTSMDEQHISDEDLLERIAGKIDTDEEAKANKAHRSFIKEFFKSREPGRYRCGPYVVEVEHREGGDIAIGKWATSVVTRITGG